jgi:KamA family protein
MLSRNCTRRWLSAISGLQVPSSPSNTPKLGNRSAQALDGVVNAQVSIPQPDISGTASTTSTSTSSSTAPTPCALTDNAIIISAELFRESRSVIAPRKFKTIGKRSIKDVLKYYTGDRLGTDAWLDYYAVASVLPMRTNPYVIEELIDWDNVPDDPYFKLVFPQPEMLLALDFRIMRDLVRSNASPLELRDAAGRIRASMNPHPAGQMTMNVPKLNGEEVPGLQHKYGETVLFFPTEGQRCHTYCTYCFRFAQFIGDADLQFASNDAALLLSYLQQNKQVTDVLFTGGDPAMLKSKQLRRYVEPMLNNPDLEHISTIRIGSKSPAFWPYRFVTDDDADDLLRLFEEIRGAGKHVSIMAHYTHPCELRTPIAEECVRRIRGSGAQVRCQAPLIRGINDDSDTWAEMWQRQVRLGAVPYYFFCERDTGPRHYFEVPLARAHEIYQGAITQLSGIARTVRGPSMSASPGKCQVVGVSHVAGEKVFVLQFLQARNPDWAYRPFFARFDPTATWLNDLRPAFGEDKWFWEEGMRKMEAEDGFTSGQRVSR